MKTRTKVILDEWFGKTGLFVLNISARLLGAILGIDHSLERAPKRIVICKFLGMGSIIQATPLIRSLRKNFPSSEIIFVTSKGNHTLLKNIRDVDDVYCIDDSGFSRILSSAFGILKKMWRKKPDLYIDLETYSYFSTALATMSCARNRFGFYRVERNIRMGVYTHMMFFNARAPIAHSYLQMARLAGCRDIADKLYRFPVSDDQIKSVKLKLKEITGNSSGDYIVVNANASDLRIERRWPPEKFILLITTLCVHFPEKHFLLIGSGNEKDWVESIMSRFDAPVKEKVFNTAGLFSLPELFAVIHDAKLVITNDTGPMHISFALEKPTVSLFGPASPSQYGQNANAIGIYSNVYCSPCVHDFLTPPCRGDNQCMKQISVDEVANACIRSLTTSEQMNVAVSHPMNYLKDDHQTSLGIVGRN